MSLYHDGRRWYLRMALMARAILRGREVVERLFESFSKKLKQLGTLTKLPPSQSISSDTRKWSFSPEMRLRGGIGPPVRPLPLISQETSPGRLETDGSQRTLSRRVPIM